MKSSHATAALLLAVLAGTATTLYTEKSAEVIDGIVDEKEAQVLSELIDEDLEDDDVNQMFFGRGRRRRRRRRRRRSSSSSLVVCYRSCWRYNYGKLDDAYYGPEYTNPTNHALNGIAVRKEITYNPSAFPCCAFPSPAIRSHGTCRDPLAHFDVHSLCSATRAANLQHQTLKLAPTSVR